MNAFRQTLIKALIMRGARSQKNKIFKRIWEKGYSFLTRREKQPIRIKIHGLDALMPPAYPYPLIIRRFPSFNNPFVELAYQTFKDIGQPITYVDIGAAIGDTAFLINENCPGMIGKIIAIDGDNSFFQLLESNLAQIPHAIPIKAILAEGDDQTVKELMRTHPGTASALGLLKVQSSSLDTVLEKYLDQGIDLIKIDVDGFDGRVIAGAQKIIESQQPNIIFEWHPLLYENTENDYLQPFRILSKYNYNKFVWFSKFGTFSHFSIGFDDREIDWLADICRRNIHAEDWHYDIIALSPKSGIDPVALAEASFAKSMGKRI